MAVIHVSGENGVKGKYFILLKYSESRTMNLGQ